MCGVLLSADICLFHTYNFFFHCVFCRVIYPNPFSQLKFDPEIRESHMFTRTDMNVEGLLYRKSTNHLSHDKSYIYRVTKKMYVS
jgi:hypothetical protein